MCTDQEVSPVLLPEQTHLKWLCKVCYELLHCGFIKLTNKELHKRVAQLSGVMVLNTNNIPTDLQGICITNTVMYVRSHELVLSPVQLIESPLNLGLGEPSH